MNIFYGNIVDPIKQRIFPGRVNIENGKITSIAEEPNKKYKNYIIPGFVDSHIHVESSMLTPGEFGRVLVGFGTIATVSDCHEIANVKGVEAVKYMMSEAKKTPLKIYFSIPSCVPATEFDSSGAVLDAEALEELMKMDELKYLGEFMDFPGVVNKTPLVQAKLDMAKKYGKLIDGHAPGICGEMAKKYAQAGITTDHECVTPEEAIEKIGYGIKVQMREGVAVKNFGDLIPIAHEHYKHCMFCSDDLHPNVLVRGHLNLLAQRAIEEKLDIFKILQMACVNPIKHYSLDVGLLQIGDPADFIEVSDLEHFNVLTTVINGNVVFEKGKEILKYQKPQLINNFVADLPANIDVPAKKGKINIIDMIKDQVLTNWVKETPKIEDGMLVSDTQRDLLKIVNLNRYKKGEKPAIGFVRGFNLKKGAIASSVAHDSHNLLAVGTNDRDILRVLELLIKNKGGIAFADSNNELILPLPVGGIMSDRPYDEVSKTYEKLEDMGRAAGSDLFSPYMSLSFLTLLVIPDLKMSDKGLFDGSNFKFVDLYAN